MKAQGKTPPITADSATELKEIYAARFGPSIDLLRDMIYHSKVLVMGLNGPGGFLVDQTKHV